MTHIFRKAEEKIACSVCIAGAVLASLMLFLIIGEVLLRGLPSLTWYFISTPESATPHIGMGIANAIIGSIFISVFATLFATPLALGTAIYLQKYAKDTKLTRAFRFLIEALAGTPSIVLGMFALLVFAYYMKFYTGGLSLLSGSIALAVLILPVIERSIEDSITRVPHEYEDGSYAMGASKIQTIFYMVIPCCMTGIVTGMILGFGRAAEESAVVILTAGYSQFMPEFAIKNSDKLFAGIKIYPLQDLVGTLPYSVYHAYENSNVIPMSNGFAAAFILICVVLVINLLAKVVIYFGTRSTKKPSPLLRSLTRSLFGGNGRFSRNKPVPAAACAAAEIEAVRQEADIRITQNPGKPVTATASPVRTTPEIDWKETLLSGLLVNPRAPPAEAQSPVNQAGNTTTTPAGVSADPANRPVHDTIPLTIPVDDALYEDDLPLIADRPEDHKNLEEGLSELEQAFRSELVRSLEHMDGPADPGEPASFHEEEISGEEWEPVLLEEDSGTILEEVPYPGVIEVPATESWRTMTRNRLENTISGITSFPREEL